MKLKYKAHRILHGGEAEGLFIQQFPEDVHHVVVLRIRRVLLETCQIVPVLQRDVDLHGYTTFYISQ